MIGKKENKTILFSVLFHNIDLTANMHLTLTEWDHKLTLTLVDQSSNKFVFAVSL